MKVQFIALLTVYTYLCALGQIQVGVWTDKPVYRYGETVMITVTAYNPTADTIILNFGSTCQANYIIDDFNFLQNITCIAILTSIKVPPFGTVTWDLEYSDVQLGAQKFSLLQSLAYEIEQNGLCFVTEAGFHPGLPSALVLYAATHMDSIESAITYGYLNMGKGLPYSEAVDEVVESFREYNGQVFKNSQWMKTNSYEVRTCDFGGDIGRKRSYAMFFEELRALPSMFPTLRETGFYISEIHWILDWVVIPTPRQA